MPCLGAWFVRAALSYLAAGFTLGALMLANKGVPFYPPLWRLLAAHVEFLLLGWTVQVAFGVAYWILPRWQTRRGTRHPAWAAFVLLNAGIWLVVLVGWFNGPAWVLVLGRSLEAVAVAAYVIHAWARVKPWVECPA